MLSPKQFAATKPMLNAALAPRLLEEKPRRLKALKTNHPGLAVFATGKSKFQNEAKRPWDRCGRALTAQEYGRRAGHLGQAA